MQSSASTIRRSFSTPQTGPLISKPPYLYVSLASQPSFPSHIHGRLSRKPPDLRVCIFASAPSVATSLDLRVCAAACVRVGRRLCMCVCCRPRLRPLYSTDVV